MDDNNLRGEGVETPWRTKFALECIKRFQYNQLSVYRDPKLPPPRPDRPTLHPIPHPAPIIHVDGPRADHVDKIITLRGLLVQPLGLPLASPSPTTPAPPSQGQEDVERMVVGIIGAGAAGLYAAMILQDLDIQYEILEGSERAGGRIRTHHFNRDSGQDTGAENTSWNYFDAGPMRFPKIPVMGRIFDLFRRLHLDSENNLLPYIMNCPNQVLQFNGQSVRQEAYDANPGNDWFEDSGLVPPEYLQKGASYWSNECFRPFTIQLRDNLEKGWRLLMKYDTFSIRSFMATAFHDEDDEGNVFLTKDAYPNAVINWLARMSPTGVFDTAFTEGVIGALQFNWPNGDSVKYGGESPAGDPTRWYCLKGGSEKLTSAMVGHLMGPDIGYNKRVTKIEPTSNHEAPLSIHYLDGDKGLKPGSTAGTAKGEFSYVISTMSLSSLRFVDLEKCNISYHQFEGRRTLEYAASCKIGLKFRTRWWQNPQQVPHPVRGGQSQTDRTVRTVVFPSYGIDDQNADAVMIASYTLSQDAQRLAGLMHGRESFAERFLISNVLQDLSVLHSVDLQFLADDLEDWFAWDWYSDPFSLGAFAHFGPTQFQHIFPSMTQPAAGGRLVFAGEALSAQHGWIEGALDSAFCAIDKILVGANLPEKRAELHERWRDPSLNDQECQEQYDRASLQELLGAVLSTVSNCHDRQAIAEAFESIRI